MTQHRRGLTPIERNLLRYIATRRTKYPDETCYIPQRINSQHKDYTRAIEYLEDNGFIEIERRGDHHRSWVVTLKKLPETLDTKKTKVFT